MSISIKKLNVSYGEKTVLHKVDLEIASGRITGIVGPNGAGKSTLYKSILGLLSPDSGDILINGKNIENLRKKIAYVPQKDGVNWDFPTTVYDVVMMGRYPHLRFLQSIGKTDRIIAEEAMKSIGITEFADRQIGALSGGQQQRVFIARALCQQADFILLDEPFVGVDAKTEEKIVDILRQLAHEGKTILMIHHDLSKVIEYFDDIVLLDKKIIASGNVKDTFTKENISKAYGGQFNIL